MLGGTRNQKFSFTELRIIGISLSILSLGIALAWFGLFWMSEHKTPAEKSPQNASNSGQLK